MRTLVVYESMYGNTHVTAERIAEGLRPAGDVVVVPVTAVTSDQVAAADVLVVGGPTHVHGLSSTRSRQAAADRAAGDDGDLDLDPDAEGTGLHTWLQELGDGAGRRAAAFDTRASGPPVLTGRASRGIARRLRHHGFRVIGDPESFLVDKQSHLQPGEEDRAQRWGEELCSALTDAG